MSRASEILEPYLAEMAGGRPADTGLEMRVWFTRRISKKKNVSLTVSQIYGKSFDPKMSFGIYFDNEVLKTDSKVGEIKKKDIKLAGKFLKLNMAVITDYWNLEIDDDELKSRLKPI